MAYFELNFKKKKCSRDLSEGDYKQRKSLGAKRKKKEEKGEKTERTEKVTAEAKVETKVEESTVLAEPRLKI